MSVQTKKRFKNLGKIIGIVLFALLMFTNIKVALMDDAELASGDITVLGVEMTLFEATYAHESSNDKLSAKEKDGSWYYCCRDEGHSTCPSAFYSDCDDI